MQEHFDLDLPHGKALKRYYGFILSPSKQTAPRGVVLAAKGHQIGLSACNTVVHTDRRHAGYLHDEIVLPGLYVWISDGRDLGGNTAAPIRGRHNIFYPGLRDCGSHPLQHDGHLL